MIENPFTKVDLAIEARWVAPVLPRAAVLEHTTVVIDQGIIRDLLPIHEARQHYSPVCVISLDDHVLIPGLINLHTHAAMTLLRGLADDMPLMTWLQQHIWPAEAEFVSERF